MRALTFDVFGTLLDLRSTIASAFGDSGLEADPGELADDWRARTVAATQDVNQKQRPWETFDQLREITLGELLDAAEAAGFDVLVTVDRGFRYEQNLAGRKIAVVIFRTKSIALKDLLPHAPEALVALQSMKPGRVVHVGR